VTANEDGSLGMILIYERLMAMPELAGSRSQIEALCGAAHLSYALYLLQAGRGRDARKHLRDAMTTQGLTPKIGLAFALASLPGTLGAATLRALRHARRWR